ncbi:hypothetical protein CJ030_MR7G008131 [Morella rubra]|uniref:Uncharacterized protein n=1 Tax=Morella rubra TaxID=262757 RepID=A0A6A1V2T5_9ROSI|nr:hypothetical protein CJ030_MR7G008131 [Morella rubra]
MEQLLKELLMILIWLYRNLKKQDSHDWFYIHCDGALFGLMMPFVKHASILCFSDSYKLPG